MVLELGTTHSAGPREWCLRLCGVKVPAELWQRAKAEGLLPASMEIS